MAAGVDFVLSRHAATTMSDIRIEGVEKLAQRLRRMEGKLGRQGAVAILKKGAPPIKKEMKQLAPKRSGNLHKAIATRRGKKNREAGENVVIGPRGGKKGAPYAHIVELGSRGGTYTAKRGKFSVFIPGGGTIRVKSIQRRGVRGIGFIAAAYKNKVKDAEDRIATEINKIVIL